MTKTEIRTLAAEGYAPSDILAIMTTLTGAEYLDAKWLITITLRLSAADVADMIATYDL